MKAFLKKYKDVIVSSILFVITLASGITALFAWYINNQRTSASGLNVSSDNANIEIREIINIKRYMAGNMFSEKNYHRFTDGYYYEYDMTNSSYVLDNGNKVAMNIYSIYPTEHIDITMWFRKNGEISTDDYSLYLTDFDDTNGKFYNYDNNNVAYEHSIKGVFRTGEVKEEMSYNWLGGYNGDYLSDTSYDRVLIKAGKFSTDQTDTFNSTLYYRTTFRIELNLEQYYAKLNAITNALSEKSLIIGKIRLVA
ncbi:MAG: hypothetical protein IJU60_06270 [Acholeplasmatales bacterium]|nr:hypothetical protein [Acholeplasmatales bacterium]